MLESQAVAVDTRAVMTPVPAFHTASTSSGGSSLLNELATTSGMPLLSQSVVPSGVPSRLQSLSRNTVPEGCALG